MTKSEAISQLQERIDLINKDYFDLQLDKYAEALQMAIEALNLFAGVGKKASADGQDCISRQAAIEDIRTMIPKDARFDIKWIEMWLMQLPSVQPERKWIPCSNPPKHHKDVIVRGIEAIGNVTVHKVMQWDVDTWRPTDYAPSVMWKEWSEI